MLRRHIFNGKKREGSTLDFGCGERGFIPELAQTYDYVVGLDMCLEVPDHYSLKNAQSLVGILHLNNVDLINAECHNIPFRDCSFDVVIANHVLEHLMKPESALKDVKRVLKKDGRIFIAVPSLSEFFSSSFNPNPIIQWGKILLTRALDDVRYRRRSLFLNKLFFSFDGGKVRLRRFIPRQHYAKLWYRGIVNLEEYANEFLSGNLIDPHHKHLFTRKEWMTLVRNAGLTIEACEGIFTIYIIASK